MVAVVLLAGGTAMAQCSDEIPFTDDELLAAFRLVLSDVEARELIRHIRTPPPGTDDRNVIGGTRLSDDTLELLASVSGEMAARVEEYRQRPWFCVEPDR